MKLDHFTLWSNYLFSIGSNIESSIIRLAWSSALIWEYRRLQNYIISFEWRSLIHPWISSNPLKFFVLFIQLSTKAFSADIHVGFLLRFFCFFWSSVSGVSFSVDIFLLLWPKRLKMIFWRALPRAWKNKNQIKKYRVWKIAKMHQN